MGALAEKLIEHNLAMPKKDSPLFMAALEYFKKGGGHKRAHEIIDRAYARINPNDDSDTGKRVRNSAVCGMYSESSASRDHHTTAHQIDRAPARNLYGTDALNARNAGAHAVFDLYKTADGQAWGEVGAHELDGMARDGAMAKAIREHIGVLTNSQRFKKVRELISPEQFETIRKQVNG